MLGELHCIACGWQGDITEADDDGCCPMCGQDALEENSDDEE
jgi:predicted RNA-binding Zn-ribbon protein involved in translation (DUF1610 family)